MPINLHWYAQNATRSYPLADSATAADQNGGRLRTDIITDLNLRYPVMLGSCPYIAGVVVTSTLVSVTIQCATSTGDNATFAPLAAVSIAQPVTPGIHYPVAAQYPGVGGWIVFGPGVAQPYAGRFSAGAGQLARRAARGYKLLPVPSLGKQYSASPLTGIVGLSGEAPISIIRDTRVIEGATRDVAVIQLAQPIAPASSLAAEVNVFQDLAGPCGNRPESNTCGGTAPMEFLNAVPPDCNGNITIVLQGCGIIGKLTNAAGVIVDCALGLADVCLPDTLPAADGKLQTEYADQCGSDISESVSVSATPATVNPDVPLVSESLLLSGSLPYSETFDAQTSLHWKIVGGSWTFADDDSPGDPSPSFSYSTEDNGTAARNVAVWSGFDHSTLNRSYISDIKLLSSPFASKHNGGIVVNYRANPAALGEYVFFLAEIDYEAQQFRIRYYNGVSLVATTAFADLVGLQLDRWYRIQVTTIPGAGTNVQLTATLTGLSGPALTATVGPLTTTAYLPANGYVGLHADRACTRFSYLDVKEES